MASELTITAMLAFSKNNVEAKSAQVAKQFDVSGNDAIRRTQIIGNSAEALDVGEIGTVGYGMFINLGPTDSISIRIGSSGADVVKLNPNECALFRLAASNPYAVASGTASPVLDYMLVEN